MQIGRKQPGKKKGAQQTMTGLLWMTEQLSQLDGWIDNKRQQIFEQVAGPDKSVYFHDPWVWCIGLLVQVPASLFTGVCSISLWPRAAAKDVVGVFSDAPAALSSALLSPFYAVLVAVYHAVLCGVCLVAGLLLPIVLSFAEQTMRKDRLVRCRAR